MKNEKILDNVLHIKDITEVIIGYLQNKNLDDTDPAVTCLRGIICLCDKTLKDILNEDSKEIK